MLDKLFEKDKVVVFGVYRMNRDVPYEVKVLEFKNTSKRHAKQKMYDYLFKPTEDRPGISHRNIVEIFTEPKNGHL